MTYLPFNSSLVQFKPRGTHRGTGWFDQFQSYKSSIQTFYSIMQLPLRPRSFNPIIVRFEPHNFCHSKLVSILREKGGLSSKFIFFQIMSRHFGDSSQKTRIK